MSTYKFVPTYNLDQLESKIHLIRDQRNVFIHVLTNDISKICQQYYKSDAVKERDLKSLAKKLDAIITDITTEKPNIHVFISMVLSRHDNMDQLNTADGRDIVNYEITSRLQNKNNVTLISNDIEQRFFKSDNYHLCPFGFQKCLSKYHQAATRVPRRRAAPNKIPQHNPNITTRLPQNCHNITTT